MMSRLVLVFALAASLLAAAGTAAGAPPRVVVTIPPLHALAAAVMGDQGELTLLLEGGQSPHTYTLRPSEARALSRADLVVWVGPELESFLPRAMDSIAGSARSVAVHELPHLTLLPTREGGIWAAHAHEHDEHAHEEEHDEGEDHGHEDGHEEGHDEHAHEEEHHEHDEHAHEDGDHGHEDGHEEEHHEHDEHAHGEVDMHLWLDPLNAKAIVHELATALAEADPAQAAAYRQRAEALSQRLDALHHELEHALAPVDTVPYIVFHDAYQYLEHRYGLNAVGAVTVSPDQAPGVRRLAELRDTIQARGAACVFAEPQFEPRLVRTIVEGTGARVATLDPLGAAIEPGPEQYFTLMRGVATALRDCLAGG